MDRGQSVESRAKIFAVGTSNGLDWEAYLCSSLNCGRAIFLQVWFLCKGGGGVVVSVRRAVPKSECMFVNIYPY